MKLLSVFIVKARFPYIQAEVREIIVRIVSILSISMQIFLEIDFLTAKDL